MFCLLEMNSWLSLFFHLDLGHELCNFQLLVKSRVSKLFVLEDNLEREVELLGDREMTECLCS